MKKFKTLKINEPLHLELKIFAATKSESIIEFIECAVTKELKKRGHRFVTKEYLQSGKS